MKNKKHAFIFFINIFWLASVWFSESMCMEGTPPAQTDYSALKMTLINDDNITNLPYSAVLSLECRFENGSVRAGSGFLIDNQFALTAAHVVYHEGEYAYDIICRTHRYGSLKNNTIIVKSYASLLSYEKFEAHCKRLSYEWPKLKPLIEAGCAIEKAKHDYALLMLNEPLTEIEVISLITPLGLKISGYPGKDYNQVEKDRDHGEAAYLYEDSSDISDILMFNKICFGGMSGGPVFVVNCDMKASNTTPLQASAIISQSSELEDGNNDYATLACAFTNAKIKRIERWKKNLQDLEKTTICHSEDTNYKITHQKISTGMSVIASDVTGWMGKILNLWERKN